MKPVNLLACMIAIALASGAPAAFAAPAKAAAPAALSLASVNDASLTETVTEHSRGAATLRAQVLLDRWRFSPGEIDGAFGSNMRHAIAGFQVTNGLPVTGAVDAATWTALNRDGAVPLVEVTIAAADVAGPFTPIPTDMMEKSKLSALGYGSALEAISEKYHVAPRLLQQLNPGKDFSRAGETIAAPNVETGVEMPAAAKVVVDKSDSTVSLLDASDNVIAQFPATMGSEHDPLPVGEWKIQGVARNPVFHYNPELFWDANPTHSKATIPAGPNNPVGVVWVDLSKEHYGIHGTPEPSKIGKTESHGCIRLTNWNALQMAASVKPGLPAILQD